MVLISTALVEFRETLAGHIKALERAYPQRYSVDWFFLRYVKRVERRAQTVESAREIMSAMRGLTRFYIDRVEEGSSLAERFDDILQAHRHALRSEHER